MARPDDTVTLLIGGQAFTGWQDVRIVRGVEMMPSHFALRLTERLPGASGLLAIDPGATCRVKLGQDVVITGFVDSYNARVNAKSHEITVIGRSSTEDLVDCAAGVTAGHETEARMTFSAPSLLQLANDLCKPFGITATAPDGEGEPIVSTGDGIPQFTIPLNASVYDVLEEKARWKQMLLLDGTDGNLVLAKLGTKTAASGFTMPGSVIDAGVSFNKQDRFSVYLPALFNIDQAFDVAAASQTTSSNYLGVVADDAAFKDQPRWDGARALPTALRRLRAAVPGHRARRAAGEVGEGAEVRPLAGADRDGGWLARRGRHAVDAEHAGAGRPADAEAGQADLVGGRGVLHARLRHRDAVDGAADAEGGVRAGAEFQHGVRSASVGGAAHRARGGAAEGVGVGPGLAQLQPPLRRGHRRHLMGARVVLATAIASKDNEAIQGMQARLSPYQVRDNVAMVGLHGVVSRPLPGAQLTVLQQDGDPTKSVCVGVHDPRHYQTGLADGVVGTAHHLGASVLF